TLHLRVAYYPGAPRARAIPAFAGRRARSNVRAAGYIQSREDAAFNGKTVVERANLFDSYNAGYAQELYDRYLQNPALVDESWRRCFGAGGAARAGLIAAEGGAAAAPGITQAQLRTAVAAAALVDAYRLHGHLAAKVDPLGSPPVGHPML